MHFFGAFSLCFLGFLAFVNLATSLLGNTQSVGVRGVLMCNGRPSVGTKVKLYDRDRTDMDDLLAEGVTGRDGSFLLQGTEDEYTTIDPKLNIYHDCNDGLLPCLLKFSIEIPDRYITRGSIPSKIFDAGTLNLEGKFSGQTRDCLN